MRNRTIGFGAASALLLGTLIVACGPGAGKVEDGSGGTGNSGDGDLCLVNCGDGDGDDGIKDVGDIDKTPEADCNDGKVAPGREACDDGNNEDGDGCWGNCLGVERGYICREPGMPCTAIARCGDGAVIFPEQCDDSNTDPGDGCSASCKVEIGFKCDDKGCTETKCGDGIVEGAEMCEPGTEGCNSQCQFSPDCSGEGACTSECGDGLVLGEACDDGNRVNGDGCDENCAVEGGYECGVEEGECEKGATSECILRVPVTYRDFDASHSDFEANECAGGQDVALGLVNPELTNKKPVTVSGAECTSKISEWYSDAHPAAKTIYGELVLYETTPGFFVNRYGANGEKWAAPYMNAGDCACGETGGCEYDGNPLFFPVDEFGTAGGQVGGLTPDYGVCWKDDATTGVHNFHFTSEVVYWFPYNADTNATLEFNGDDDLWVFVNGKLALDVGGIHPPKNGSFTVSGASPTLTGGTGVAHGMTAGNVYEIKVFHAERRMKGSTFKLTLSGFNSRRSDCKAICGDGMIGFGEECDDGADNGAGYNSCQDDCRLGAFCGDGIKQDNEICDDNDPEAPAGCSGCSIVVVK